MYILLHEMSLSIPFSPLKFLDVEKVFLDKI